MSSDPSAELKQEEGVKLPKNTTANRYYYKHREEILEKQRLARLSKKSVDITKPDEQHPPQLSLEERRKKKMEFLGLA